MTALKDIEGIGEATAKKFAEKGIRSVEALLKAGASAAGRKDLADQAGVSADKLLTWVNHADLFRIRGIASQYSELLEAAGVDSVIELAQRNAKNLTEALAKANAAGRQRIVQALPSMKRVEGWIEQAKKMTRVVTH
jgi:predicted flap endonuclease-1-like 5' DNA nuclease